MATKNVVTLPRQRAVKLLMFCGWHAAPEWDDEKLAAKLPELTKVYDPQKDAKPDDEEIASDLSTVVLAIEAGDDFEVTADESSEASGDFFEDAKNVDKKRSKAKKAKKETAASPVSGVRLIASRAHHAANIIKEAGLSAGITDAMVQEVDKRYGKPNEKYSKYALTNAWHALNAYLGEFPVEAEE